MSNILNDRIVSSAEAVSSREPISILGGVPVNFVQTTQIEMKRDKIIYWVATGLVAAGMGLSAYMYLSKNPQLVSSFTAIGFPVYFITILGVAKLLGAIVLVAPLWSKLKEWAYAGFLFVFTGAIWVHIETGTPFVGPLAFLAILAVSYIFWTRLSARSGSGS